MLNLKKRVSHNEIELGDSINPDLSLEVPDLAVDVADMNLSLAEQTPNPPSQNIEKPPVDIPSSPNQENMLSEILSIDIETPATPIEEPSFSNEEATSVGHIDDVVSASTNTLDESSYHKYNNSSELQYIDSYPEPSHNQQALIFGPNIPGENIEKVGEQMDNILRMMIEQKASDIHFTQGEEVCLRIDGEIERVPVEL